jgi:hypothetical protein
MISRPVVHAKTKPPYASALVGKDDDGQTEWIHFFGHRLSVNHVRRRRSTWDCRTHTFDLPTLLDHFYVPTVVAVQKLCAIHVRQLNLHPKLRTDRMLLSETS